MKDKQKDIIKKIVMRSPNGIRTEMVKIEGLHNSVSCADRYLRWLREDGVIRSIKKDGDDTKTWFPVYEKGGQLKLC